MATERGLRADAQRNHDVLLRVAADAFSDDGPQVPLQEIACRAQVGIGTLYRHFADRETLILEVYRRTVGQLCAGAYDLLATQPGDDALELWLNRFVEHVRTQRPMTVILTQAAGLSDQETDACSGMPPLFTEMHALLGSAIEAVLTEAARQGLVRDDIDSADLLRALGALCQLDASPAQSSRLVGLLVDGLRFGAPAAAGRASGAARGRG